MGHAGKESVLQFDLYGLEGTLSSAYGSFLGFGGTAKIQLKWAKNKKI